MITNLTEGKPSRVLWRFSMPMLLSILFQQLYNMADSAVVGRFVNENALSAVGVSYPITMIFMAVAAGSSVGGSVVISRLFGGGEVAQMRTAIGTTLWSMGAVSVVLTVVGLVFCPQLLALVGTPSEIFADAAAYLRIYSLGLVFLFLYNSTNAVFTALGDSRTPLLFLIGSSVGNIVLDLIFVIRFDWGVPGVAWATLIAQGVSAALSCVVLRRRLHIFAGTPAPTFSFEALRRIGTMALPSILQQSFVSVGNLFVQTMVNSYGAACIAGYSAAIRLNTFAITCFSTLSNGLSSFTAQNIGAGLGRRVRAGMRAGCLLALAVAVPFMVLFLGLDETMIRLFIAEPTEQALAVGQRFLHIVAPFYVVALLKLQADGVLRGAGAVFAFTFSTMTDLVLRVALAFVFSMAMHSSDGIWLSWPFGWTVSMLVSLLFYRFGRWRRALDGD